MRTLLLATIAVFILAITSAAQQTEATKADVSASLEKLHSEQWTDRARAYARLRMDKEAFEKESVRLALMDLLGRENTLIESVLRESHEQAGVSDKYGEGYAEYYSKLLDTVSSIANWKDPNQLCILTHGSYDPESAFASRLAAAGSAAVPCLVKMSGSDLGLTRAKAVAVLVRISAKSRLDSATSQSIRQIVLRALRDSSDTVRSDAVHALGKFGGEDMIEALREVEQSDPSPEVQGLSIRAEATEAIAAIHRRTGGH